MKREAGFEIIKSGHIELLVTDLNSAKDFYVERLGFFVTYQDDSHVYLRGSEERYHHSLLLSKSDSPGVGHIAFRLRSDDDLMYVKKMLKDEGLEFKEQTNVERGVSNVIRFQDPFGFPVEFYHSMDKVEWMIRSYHLQRGARISRLDHFNLLVPDATPAYDWYVSKLGFVCTELTEMDNDPNTIWAAWLRRKHTCHDVAIMTGKGPRVHHAGFTVPDRASIMDCADILASSGYVKSIERGPGRHGISNAFFLYLRDADGNRIELYTGDYLSSDPDWEPIRWKLNDPQRQTFWGAKTPESWFNEAMLVRSFFSSDFVRLNEPKIADRPFYLAH
ncbi:MAG: 3,4-dihydroxyphenylacetate 2,3-dioxygenase [Conexivisphaerales archaeon]